MSAPHWQDFVLHHTGARAIQRCDIIQSLWSGYGQLLKLHLDAGEYPSVILKYVQLPETQQHPRGWQGERSQARKVRSYEVECHWYQHYSAECDGDSRVAKCLATERGEQQWWMLLEDLDAAGFSARQQSLEQAQAERCLTWLAAFHARFLRRAPEGLWPTGCYWHLQTRPDELAAMPEGPLKRHAATLDQRLSSARFQTLVHGDAKVANFCFNPTSPAVAAVDFQYVGAGVGIRDVAYFLGSCLDEGGCARLEAPLLDAYFSALQQALRKHQPQIDAPAVEDEWRALYAIAWTDFYRFLQGWMPTHPKVHAYTRRLAERAFLQL